MIKGGGETSDRRVIRKIHVVTVICCVPWTATELQCHV